MPDQSGPAFVSFAGGFFSGRVESMMREAAQQTWFNLLSIDPPTPGGATVTAAQTTQATGYQIQASNTLFGTVPAGSACVLPQTSRPFPFTGLMLFICNVGANGINCYPHPNDPNNSINSQAANLPVVLGVNTITPFQCFTPGIWFADSIGTGFAGSLETIVSQQLTASTTNTQAAATQVTQAMVNVTVASANNAVALPKAIAGLQVTLNVGAGNVVGNTPLQVYPLNGSGDTINAGGANAPLAVTLPLTTPLLFFCFTNGAWTTK